MITAPPKRRLASKKPPDRGRIFRVADRFGLSGTSGLCERGPSE
jgi:hypothetical protein